MKLRVPLALLALVAGVVVGTASTVVHGLRVGLVLALVATLATVAALPPGWWSRLPFGVGWLLVVFYFSNPRPEGDYLVASNVDGYLLLGTGMAIVAFGIVTLRPARARPRPIDDSGAAADPS
ncbi:hypothetical protein BH09ACT12_BH09ACT12_04410 [soil metagenome]